MPLEPEGCQAVSCLLLLLLLHHVLPLTLLHLLLLLLVGGCNQGHSQAASARKMRGLGSGVPGALLVQQQRPEGAGLVGGEGRGVLLVKSPLLLLLRYPGLGARGKVRRAGRQDGSNSLKTSRVREGGGGGGGGF